ncbi:MAG: 23S rRNA (pseudouridine(1915)-N(3))-methyltransferase RlmH, partial [Candidatus Magasanikbacteria bacterium]|nr:23S rRNA (pseudouridine(1915)-N(3))-methyltransferase RlmH [Candidatus Magasanikbacteria bacterium]
NFVFVIGGPLGLDESILKMANLKLSFSAFTFTHQMIRVFLLEQIYRAMMIGSGRQYHY